MVSSQPPFSSKEARYRLLVYALMDIRLVYYTDIIPHL
jgi:hypothetical protein